MIGPDRLWTLAICLAMVAISLDAFSQGMHCYYWHLAVARKPLVKVMRIGYVRHLHEPPDHLTKQHDRKLRQARASRKTPQNRNLNYVFYTPQHHPKSTNQANSQHQKHLKTLHDPPTLPHPAHQPPATLGLHGIILRRRTIGAEDLASVRAGAILHSALEGTTPPAHVVASG